MPPKKVSVQSNTITGFLLRPRGRPRNYTSKQIVETGGGKKQKPAPEPAPKPARGRPVESSASSEHVSKKPKTRANYNLPGPAKDKMDAAVLEWVEGATPADIATSSKISESKFSKAKSLPPSTFHKHVADYKESRAPLPSVPVRAGPCRSVPVSAGPCRTGRLRQRRRRSGADAATLRPPPTRSRSLSSR